MRVNPGGMTSPAIPNRFEGLDYESESVALACREVGFSRMPGDSVWIELNKTAAAVATVLWTVSLM